MNFGPDHILTPYHAKYFAFELTRLYPSNNLEKLTASLQDAQVDLNPHQVEAALFAFKSPLSKGAILADEVGLGKTIEAGIILSQKWAERKRKLLIIAPANLRKQWSQEMADKFFLPSVILESQSFNDVIKKGNLNPFDQTSILICSYQFARSKEIYLKLTKWDLVIIDEAHRLRNVYKPSNKIASALKSALNNAPKILLTATPLQNSLLELFGLVSIIDDYTFGDIKSFRSQFSRLVNEKDYDELKLRLAPICKRTLRRQVLEYINFTNRIALVEEFYPYAVEIELYDLVSDYLRRPILYALPASQRQLMTLILRKLLASSSYAISGTFLALSDKLEKILDLQETFLDNSICENFETFTELKDEWEEEEESHPTCTPLTEEQKQEIQSEIAELKRFRKLARSINQNSKGEKLLTALDNGFEMLKSLGANLKAIIFTESTRTQEYLRNILESHGYSGKVVLFNGTNNDPGSREIYKKWLLRHENTDRVTGSKTADTRQAIVDNFRYEATIMIATEAAAEGINLQFCSLVVNYDLPWNPQRIEQRIGRCHRYGQKFDVVVINFLNKANAADQRVYQLLDEKFRLFSGVFGASDEVLGSIESGVDFEKRIARIYQECRSEEEIKLAFDELQRELEPEIELNLDITRRNLLENFDEEVHQKLKVNLEKGKEYLNRYEQWLWLITRYYLSGYANFDQSDDSFTLHTNPFPGEQIFPGPYRIIRTVGNRKKSEIELDDDINIYRVGHPLAQRIIQSCKNINLPVKEVIFDYTSTPLKISVLEDFSGKSGWLSVSLLTISSFEDEEYLLLSGISDDGSIIDPSTCQRFFSVYANESDHCYITRAVSEQLYSLTDQQKLNFLDENMIRNARFFDDELNKLEKWADDMKLSLEKEIRDLDAEIKLRKGEARKILDLQLKVNEHRIIKDLEHKRSEKRKILYEAQDDIDTQKENLLSGIEARLSQRIGMKELFTIRWVFN